MHDIIITIYNYLIENIMETIIKNLINEIKNNIIHDIKNDGGEQFGVMFQTLLNAYNRYQEDERDGVDYLFNINKKEDLKCCIDGGLRAREIHHLYEDYMKNKTPLFFFGVNHTTPILIDTWAAVEKQLISNLDNILPCMLAYHNADGYKELYDRCISDYMINNELL